MAFQAKLISAVRMAERAMQKTAAFVLKPRTTLAQMENAAAKVDSIASLWNNAVWSGGLCLAVQVIKLNSGVSGFKWLCMTALQLALGVMTAVIGIAAVHLLTDRINEGRSEGARAIVSSILMVIYLILALGFVFAIGEYMQTPDAGIVQ